MCEREEKIAISNVKMHPKSGMQCQSRTLWSSFMVGVYVFVHGAPLLARAM